ncbi:MAG: hypothetical protein EHM78_02070 [Myxococcaceae bacterium]|nr:MAG: hypothetical protein EHM78_02070 [Myxococcaceae bacterium]
MASDLSTYLGNKIVRWLGGQAMPTAPATVYLALFDGDPKAAGVEVSADVNSAGRQAIVWTVPSAGTVNVMESSDDVDWGASEGDVDLDWVAVFDAASAGNRLASKALSSPQSILTGQQVLFSAGDLSFTIGT